MHQQYSERLQEDLTLAGQLFSEAPEKPIISPCRRKLKRALRQEAIFRMEESARTIEDFRKLEIIWQREDENRLRKERYHEILRSGDELPFEYGMSPLMQIFPEVWDHFTIRQSLRGDFIEEIFYSPSDIHELVTPEYLILPLKNMKYRSKELIFLRAIEKYSTVQIAEMRNQTDRNIRKSWNSLLNILRKQSEKGLTKALQEGYSPSINEKIFLEKCRKEEPKHETDPSV